MQTHLLANWGTWSPLLWLSLNNNYYSLIFCLEKKQQLLFSMWFHMTLKALINTRCQMHNKLWRLHLGHTLLWLTFLLWSKYEHVVTSFNYMVDNCHCFVFLSITTNILHVPTFTSFCFSSFHSSNHIHPHGANPLYWVLLTKVSMMPHLRLLLVELRLPSFNHGLYRFYDIASKSSATFKLMMPLLPYY